jgi:hypothetical protein
MVMEFLGASGWCGDSWSGRIAGSSARDERGNRTSESKNRKDESQGILLIIAEGGSLGL